MEGDVAGRGGVGAARSRLSHGEVRVASDALTWTHRVQEGRLRPRLPAQLDRQARYRRDDEEHEHRRTHQLPQRLVLIRPE